MAGITAQAVLDPYTQEPVRFREVWQPKSEAMTQVRWRVVLLLLWLSVFFNVERLDLDIGQMNTINLPSSTYVIGLVAAVAALTPAFQRQHMVLLMGLAVLLHLVSLALLNEPIVGGVHIYLTLTSILMMLITIAAAYNLGRSLNEFLEAVEEMTFSNEGGRRYTERDAQDLASLEMISSRRTQRPLSIVLLQTDVSSMNMMLHRLIQDVQKLMLRRYLLATVSRVLSRYLRRTDIIVETQKSGQLVVIARETSSVEAERLGERLRQVTQERLGVDAAYSVASFPEHALTYEELVLSAEQRIRERGHRGPTRPQPEESIQQLAEQYAQDARGTKAVTPQPDAHALGETR